MPLMPRPGGSGFDSDGKPKLIKTRRVRAKNQNKVRVHLPPIESYEKELEFPADGPGRVVVRLERLMGSDRIRITDTKYMATLLERLEEQERKAWAKRRFRRIKIERNRYRQLAIDGLMEPGPDMQDLYYHPVFRVNRVLRRLTKMDSNITLTPLDKLPPIVPVDPFQHDDNGEAFKTYPGHNSISISATPAKFSTSIIGGMSNLSSRTDLGAPSNATGVGVRIKEITTEYLIFGETDQDKEREAEEFKAKMPQIRMSEHLKEEESLPVHKMSMSSRASHLKLPSRFRMHRLSDAEVPSLTELQADYGIDATETNLKDWEPFKSFLVNMVFHEDGQRVEELYNMAEDVLGVYHREIETADDFSIKLMRMMK